MPAPTGSHGCASSTDIYKGACFFVIKDMMELICAADPEVGSAVKGEYDRQVNCI